MAVVYISKTQRAVGLVRQFAFSVLSVDQEFYDCVLDSSKQWKLMADEGIVFRAGMIQELIMVRDGLLCMSTDDFTHNDVLALTEHLCVD